jgi:fucose permease
MSAASPSPAVRPGRALAVLCGVFFAAGFGMAAIGPVVPELSARTGTSLAALGWLSIAIFLGSLAAQFIAGRASDRFGRRLVLAIGLTTLAAMLSIIGLAPRLAVILTAAAIYGIGYGSFSLSGNVMASELAPEKRASAVNLVNMAFGLGAVAGPLVVSVLIARVDRALPALWIGAGLLVLSAVAARLALPAHVPAVRPTQVTGATGRASLRDPMLFAIGVLLMLYVGSEVSAGLWASEYLQRSAGMDAADAAAATSLFWALLTAGRVAAVLVGMRVSADRLLTASVWIAFAGSALLWLAHGSATASVVAFAVMGFGYGPIYPTGVAVITSRFPHAAGTATSQMGILAACGGGVLPRLQSLVLAHRPTAESAIFTLVIAAGMIGAWTVTRRAARRPPAAA